MFCFYFGLLCLFAWLASLSTKNNFLYLIPLLAENDNVSTKYFILGAPVAQWIKRWPTDLADRVWSPLEAKSFQP